MGDASGTDYSYVDGDSGGVLSLIGRRVERDGERKKLSPLLLGSGFIPSDRRNPFNGFLNPPRGIVPKTKPSAPLLFGQPLLTKKKACRKGKGHKLSAFPTV